MNIIYQNYKILHQEDFTLRGIKRFIERCGRVCYSPDTEVLTNNGWKRIDNLLSTDKVVSYNPNNNTIIYDAPNLVINDYNDDMVTIDHSNIKMCVTKDHRIYQSIPEERDYTFLEAAQIAGIKKIPHSKQCRFRIPKYFIGSKRDMKFYLPSIVYSKEIKNGGRSSSTITINIPCNIDFMVIAGAFISEGHTYHGESCATGSYCQITQDENSELYSKVITSLSNLGWSYKIYSDPRKPQIKWIRFGTNQCWTMAFDDLFGKGSKNKHLPIWFRVLPDEYLRTIISIMYLGDGSHNTTRNEKYLSISKRLLDEVQEVFILLGQNGTTNFNEKISQMCYFEESHRDSWIISRDKHISTVPYKGKVYCTSTKSGIICIRYKGKTCWCGNCYKSEDKITDSSYEKFVENLYKKDHTRPLEFGTVHLKFDDKDCFNRFRTAVVLNDIWNNQWIHYNEYGGVYYASLNYRYYLDIMKKVPNISTYRVDEDGEHYPKRYTVHFILSRAIMDEFRTHVGLSHLAESTRYCNYSKDRFNNKITFIKPDWFKEDKYQHDVHFLKPLLEAEKAYFRLISISRNTPQQARDILPLCVKSELISCGFKDAWDNFFYRRCANDAHPMAREIAIPLRDTLYK